MRQVSHGLKLNGFKMPNHAQFFPRAILTRRVGQTELTFSVQSGFISRSVHVKLQVSVYSGYDLCRSG